MTERDKPVFIYSNQKLEISRRRISLQLPWLNWSKGFSEKSCLAVVPGVTSNKFIRYVW